MTLTITGYEKAKCSSRIRERPGCTLIPRRVKGPVLLQNSSVENPSATVGIMNGISAKASIMFLHFEFPLAMNQAIGSANNRSSVATLKEMANELNIANLALAKRVGSKMT